MDSFFSLQDIKNNNKNGKQIEIPSIQRGLVWSAKQIEFLWDSILRGFPVGGFVVEEHDEKFYLIDGQQRYKAINMAFNDPDEEKTSVLWWDINPKQITSTRKFFLKITNMAQPWGFGNDDECKVLDASERRNALYSFFNDSEFNVYKNKFKITDTYPFVSQFPIPLSFFLNLNASDNVDAIIKKINTLPESWKKRYWTQANKCFLEEKFNQLQKDISTAIEKFIIPFCILPKTTIENEYSESDNQDETDVEILFNRLGSMGTQITKDELAYSTIKYYWEDITGIVEELATGFLPSYILTMIFFRLVLTEEDSEKFQRELSISQLRIMAKEIATREKIIKFCVDGNARTITEKLKHIIESEMIPKHLVMKIGKEKPDLFLLALYIINKFGNQSGFESFNLTGLLLLLLWFGERKYTIQIIDYLYLNIRKSKNTSELAEFVSKSLFSMICFGWIKNVYSPEEIKNLLLEEHSLKENSIQHEIENHYVGVSIRDYLWDTSLLLYAEREYINDNYCRYNPLDSVRWRDNKCPWDYDHILPKSWVYNQKGVNHLFRFWEYTIGNQAAIPYEVNRSKNDNADFSFYKQNTEKLYFDCDFETFDRKSVQDEEQGRLFERLVFERFLCIYIECYNSFSTLLFVGDSDESKKRKQNFIELKEKMNKQGKDINARFVLFSFEYEIVNNIDWNRQWISFEYDIDNFCVASLTFSKVDNENKWEVGLRKHPLIPSVDNEWKKGKKEQLLKIRKQCSDLNEYLGQDWWYLEKEVPTYMEAEKEFIEIVKAAKEL